MNQNDRLLDALRREPMMPLQILARLGIMRASARVYDLRNAGHRISTEIVPIECNDGHVARVARYAALPESANGDLFEAMAPMKGRAQG